MKVLHVIGADLSKKTIDFANTQGSHLKVKNDFSGFQELIKWLGEQSLNLPETIIVMEHTGLYSYQLTKFLREYDIAFAKVSALAIKRSMGLVRGKNDKVDAMRIARYGFQNKEHLHPDPPISKSMERLQILHTTRSKFVKQRAALLTTIKEYQGSYGFDKTDLVIDCQLQMIKSFDHQIAKLDECISSIVESEKSIKNNHQLLQSIKGVGKVVSMATILKTGNFTRFTVARKFACYCGTAPFENTSGTSLRGRTRVSHLADKEMKSLLDLAAKSAIQYDKELRDYYSRRIASGKSKMSTINVVRNKIVYRMFAVINRQTPFVANYIRVA